MQPASHHGAAGVPNTVPGILGALPEALRVAFRTKLATALEHGDPATVDAVIGAWWAQAVGHLDPSVRAAFAALDDATAHPTPATDRPSAARAPMVVSVFAVRTELEPFSDLRMFDREIDAAIGHAAETGSFDRLHTALRNWLAIALMAQHAATHKRLPQQMQQRAQLQQQLTEQWIHQHPEAMH
jgi:hypothetical protein